MSLVRTDITNSNCHPYWVTITTSVKTKHMDLGLYCSPDSVQQAVLQRVIWGQYPSHLINILESCSNTVSSRKARQRVATVKILLRWALRDQRYNLHVPCECRCSLHSAHSVFSHLPIWKATSHHEPPRFCRLLFHYKVITRSLSFVKISALWPGC